MIWRYGLLGVIPAGEATQGMLQHVTVLERPSINILKSRLAYIRDSRALVQKRTSREWFLGLGLRLRLGF